MNDFIYLTFDLHRFRPAWHSERCVWCRCTSCLFVLLLSFSVIAKEWSGSETRNVVCKTLKSLLSNPGAVKVQVTKKTHVYQTGTSNKSGVWSFPLELLAEKWNRFTLNLSWSRATKSQCVKSLRDWGSLFLPQNIHK